MAKQKQHSWEIEVKGFGPFTDGVKNVIKFSTSRVSVYAGNGQGKTCLSRLFRGAELGADAISDGMISRGSHAGSFVFRVASKGQVQGSLEVNKTSGEAASISDTTGYLFHVFNSDYVRKNLDQFHYAPSGNISGYILGEENIDLSDKKERLSELGEEGKALRETLDTVIGTARAQLIELGVSSRIKEYAALTLDHVIDLSAKADHYDERLSQLKALRGIPEDVVPFGELVFTHTQLDYPSLQEILSHAYTRDQFAEDFLSSVSRKRTFITEGMRIQDGAVCPFCGRSYNDEARSLIRHYEEYLAGQEAKTVAALSSRESSVVALKNEYSSFVAAYLKAGHQYDALKVGFPDYAGTSLPDLPDKSSFDEIADRLVSTLEDKAADITITCDTHDATNLEALIEQAEQAASQANNLLTGMNNALSKRSASLLAAKKDLCSAVALKLRNDHDADINRLVELRRQYKDLRLEIQGDESRTKKSKRDAVAELFGKLLREVFGDKYSFDEDRFAITFQNSDLGDEAAQVLSDGEKSALAFCFYIASTHEILDNQTDTSKLFFVIDDPISSLDYHYVYSISQIIKDLNLFFGIGGPVRFLLLTHNTAFYNMLARNNIAKEHFILHGGEITRCTGQGIIPYAEHLKDLYDVVEGGAPTHTTGNSIRQVIETLWRFDEPDAKDLLAYIDTDRCRDLAACEYVYTLCQDRSHGASIFDTMQPVDEMSIRKACKTVLDHIASNYPGQLVVSDITYELKP